jgi:DNA-binding IclR family transcriptional regulator
VRQARETAYVAVLRRDGVVPVEVVEADRSVRIVSQVGETLPLHCTAAGKALLAFQPEEDLRGILPDPLSKFTDRTPADRQALQQQLKSVASSGYAIDMGEHMEDVRGVAAPIRDYARNVVGALAIVGPAYRFQAERIDKELAPLAVKAGRDLSSRLGFDSGKREAS